MNSYQYNRHQLSWKTGVLISWLDHVDADTLAQETIGWTERDWSAMQLAILMQGVGPLLYLRWKDTAHYSHLPGDMQSWLSDQYTLNSLRLARMQDELLAILHQSNEAGIQVMPLKGSLIAWRYYTHPGVRPMADLDLLIHPEDREEIIRILQRLKYVYDPADSNEHAQHMAFKPANSTVVYLHGEHPDNPRPVEVHWRLQKGVYGDITGCDFTDGIWSTAQCESWSGVHIWKPELSMYTEYVAFHALAHLLFFAGRLIHWLDLAQITRELEPFVPQYPNWFYPVLRLTERAIPRQFQFDLSLCSREVHPRIAYWADNVPLDSRCGLASGPPPHLTTRRRQHWRRWWPTAWRMRLGYYDSPLLLAYGRHTLNWLTRLWEKLSARSQNDSPFDL